MQLYYTLGITDKLKSIRVNRNNFKTVKSNNFIYVDKTMELWKLVNEPDGVYFLSALAGFVKSLCCSTIK